MKSGIKEFLYERGISTQIDGQFDSGKGYGKIRMGSDALFWKEGFRWYAVELSRAERIYRQVEYVYGKLCCGGRTYDIQRLIVMLKNGTTLKLHIGDDMQTQAEALFEALKAAHPQIQYKKA